MSKDAEGEFSVGSGEMQAANKAANFFFGGSGGAALLGCAGVRFQIAAGTEGVEQKRCETFEIGGRGSDIFFGLQCGFRIAHKLVKANGDGLAEIHGAMLFAGGDAQEPMAMAEVFVRKAALFGAEQKGDSTAGQMLMDKPRSLLKAANRMQGLAAADGSGSHDEGAIRDGFGDSFEFFGAGEQRLSTDGGPRFAESQFVWIDDAKMSEAEVTHGAGSGSDVQRIARLDEDNAQVVEFGMGRQGSEFTAGKK